MVCRTTAESSTINTRTFFPIANSALSFQSCYRLNQNPGICVTHVTTQKQIKEFRLICVTHVTTQKQIKEFRFHAAPVEILNARGFETDMTYMANPVTFLYTNRIPEGLDEQLAVV